MILEAVLCCFALVCILCIRVRCDLSAPRLVLVASFTLSVPELHTSGCSFEEYRMGLLVFGLVPRLPNMRK